MQLSQAVELTTVVDSTIFLGYDPTTGKPIQIPASEIKTYNPQSTSENGTLDLSSIPIVTSLGTGDYVLCISSGVLSKIRPNLIGVSAPFLSWTLEDTDGTSANDSTGNNNVGTYQTISTGGLMLSSSGVNLNGGGQVYSSKLNNQPSELTIKISFNTTNQNTGEAQYVNPLWDYRDNINLGSATNKFPTLLLINTSLGTLYLYDNNNNVSCSGNPYNDGDWHTAIVSISPTETIIMVDGLEVGTFSGNLVPNFAGYFCVGSSEGFNFNRYFIGQLKNFQVWLQALSVSQMQALF